MLARGVSQCAHCERSTRLQTRSLINYLYARNAAFPSLFFSSLCFRSAIKSRCSQPFITVKGPTARSRDRILTIERLCLLDPRKKQKKCRSREESSLYRNCLYTCETTSHPECTLNYSFYCREMPKFIRSIFFT